MTFIGRQRERLLHAGIVASLTEHFRDSVAVVSSGSDAFAALSAAFPPVPSDLAVSSSLPDDESSIPEQAAGSDGR